MTRDLFFLQTQEPPSISLDVGGPVCYDSLVEPPESVSAILLDPDPVAGDLFSSSLVLLVALYQIPPLTSILTATPIIACVKWIASIENRASQPPYILVWLSVYTVSSMYKRFPPTGSQKVRGSSPLSSTYSFIIDIRTPPKTRCNSEVLSVLTAVLLQPRQQPL